MAKRRSYNPKRGQDYPDRIKELIRVNREAERDTMRQFMFDLVGIVLHSPKYMGSDSFGKDRINNVRKGINEMYDDFIDALNKDVESDYRREQLDRELKDTCEESDFAPFSERYDWIEEITY